MNPTPAKRATVLVSERVCMQRINRRLGKCGHRLRTAMPEEVHAIGTHYVISVRNRAILLAHVDPEKLGRRIGLLRPWERVEKVRRDLTFGAWKSQVTRTKPVASNGRGAS